MGIGEERERGKSGGEEKKGVRMEEKGREMYGQRGEWIEGKREGRGKEET